MSTDTEWLKVVEMIAKQRDELLEMVVSEPNLKDQMEDFFKKWNLSEWCDIQKIDF